MCFDSANLHGTGAARKRAGDKGTGSGRVRYGRREVLPPLSPPPPHLLPGTTFLHINGALQQSEPGTDKIREKQRKDPELNDYVQGDTLPNNDAKARRILLRSDSFYISQDGRFLLQVTGHRSQVGHCFTNTESIPNTSKS